MKAILLPLQTQILLLLTPSSQKIKSVSLKGRESWWDYTVRRRRTLLTKIILQLGGEEEQFKDVVNFRNQNVAILNCIFVFDWSGKCVTVEIRQKSSYWEMFFSHSVIWLKDAGPKGFACLLKASVLFPEENLKNHCLKNCVTELEKQSYFKSVEWQGSSLHRLLNVAVGHTSSPADFSTARLPPERYSLESVSCTVHMCGFSLCKQTWPRSEVVKKAAQSQWMSHRLPKAKVPEQHSAHEPGGTKLLWVCPYEVAQSRAQGSLKQCVRSRANIVPQHLAWHCIAWNYGFLIYSQQRPKPPLQTHEQGQYLLCMHLLVPGWERTAGLQHPGSIGLSAQDTYICAPGVMYMSIFGSIRLAAALTWGSSVKSRVEER